MLVTAAFVIVADQLSKAWVVANLDPGERIAILGDILGIRLTTNPGGAFGLFPGATLFFFVASLAIVVVVVVWALRDLENPGAFGMVLGGGIGNLIDRLVRPPAPMRGRVIDFLDLSFWPTFNIADSAIVLGVIVLFAAAVFQPGKDEPSK